MTNIFDLLLDPDERLEDETSLASPDFNIDPQWSYELDLHYAQGDFQC